MLVVGVPHTEAAAEVVDLEGAERSDGFDRRRQLVDVEQLRADVGVHSVEPHAWSLRSIRAIASRASSGIRPNLDPA